MKIYVDKNGVPLLDCGNMIFCDGANRDTALGAGVRIELETDKREAYTVHLAMTIKEQEWLIEFLQAMLREAKGAEARRHNNSPGV